MKHMVRIAADAHGPLDVRPGELYAVHTDDTPGMNDGTPMQETAVCWRCVDTWGGAAIEVAEGADDEPANLVLSPIDPAFAGDFECNYHYPGEFDAGAPAEIGERGW